jgi:hypothetical protein
MDNSHNTKKVFIYNYHISNNVIFILVDHQVIIEKVID